MYEYEKALLKKKLGSYYEMFKDYNCFLAGGAINSLFTHAEINDYDLYFRSQQDLYGFMTESPSSTWIIADSDKSFTVKVANNMGELIVQPIFFRYFDNAEQIFESFDFTVCMGAFDFQKEEFVLHEDFLNDIAARRLVFNPNTAFPIISALRIAKYKEKGYEIDRRQFMRIMLTISRLKITSLEMLRRHLGGMYGESIEAHIKIDENEPFDLNKIIERMGEYTVEEDEREIPTVYFEDDYELYIAKKIGMKIPIVQIGDKYYTRNSTGLRRIKPDAIDENFVLDRGFTVNEFPMVKYKCVKKIGDGLYRSFYDSDFVYELGRVAEAKNCHHGLYMVGESGKETCQYSDKEGAVMLKLLIMDARDVTPRGLGTLFCGNTTADRVYVMEEIPIKKESV